MTPDGSRDQLTDLERNAVAQIHLGLQGNRDLLLCLPTCSGQCFILHMESFEIHHLQRHVRLDLLFKHRDRMAQGEIGRSVRGNELNINGLG